MTKMIYFAGGCFWGMEKYFLLIEGVVDTEVGYANGTTANPSYEQVCTGQTHHAETVRVEYDPARVALKVLIELFLDAIDPTSVNKQGGDVGTQYRTGIYYTDEADLFVIQREIDAIRPKFVLPIAVEVMPFVHFFPAEEYHQRYLEKNPAGYCHIGAALFEHAATGNK